MKIILLDNVDKIGKKYELKEVKSGFARNFLFPKGLAKPATKENLKWLKVQKEIRIKKAEESLKKIQEKAAAVDGQEIVILVKVGKNNQLFESITSQKISEKLKELGFEIKKDQIILEEPIKEIGEVPLKIKFEDNLEAEIKIVITPEENPSF